MASASICADERKTSRPPALALPPWIQCRGQSNITELRAIHESLQRRDTRQFIMSTRSWVDTETEAVEQTGSYLQQVLSEPPPPPLQTPTTLKPKKLEAVEEINHALSGRDNKFAAYMESGNPICLVPYFHGKTILFSCFQRAPKSAMISSFRSN